MRRARGSGSVFRVRCTWHIAFIDASGQRVKESSGSQRKGDAERLLTSRNGAVIHRLPIVPRAETVTFRKAADALITEYEANGRRSYAVVKRRIEKHLIPVFGAERLTAITSTDVVSYVAHRQAQGIERKGVRVSDVSNGEVNRELQTLKRIFNLAMEQDRIAQMPTIKMLKEAPARAGFFEREQYESVLAHLPEEIRPVVIMAYVTGWRVHDEILPLQWRHVDFASGEVRLFAGETKNFAGRVFPFTDDLKMMLLQQHAEHLRLKKQGVIVPWCFWRMVAKTRGGEKFPKPIVSFGKAWKAACKLAGCPGKIPHDLRRTAIRSFVRSGTSESVAMKLSGHKTRSVFDRYNIVSGDDLKDAAARLNVNSLSSGSSSSGIKEAK